MWLAHEESQRLLVQAAEFLEFHSVYSAFSTLTFGDERLRPAQGMGYLDLGEAGLTAGLPESLQKRSIFLAIGCVFQDSLDYCEPLLNIPN